MTIHIEDLTFDVIIGLLDFERDAPQKVILNLKILYPYKKDVFINYADVVTHIKEKMRKEKYTLLEDAVSDINTLLKENYPEIIKIWIKISKPDILSECIVSLSKTWDY